MSHQLMRSLPFVKTTYMINLRPLILTLWVSVLSTGAIAQKSTSDTTYPPQVCVKLLSSPGSYPVEVEMQDINLHKTMNPKERTGFYMMVSIPKYMAFAITYGDDLLHVDEGDYTGGVVKRGKWVFVIMYNKKHDSWKGVLRPYNFQIDGR